LDREILEMRRLATIFEGRKETECDPRVRVDLDILAKFAKQTLRAIAVQQKYTVPYTNVSGDVYGGVSALLRASVAQARRNAALTRLRAYSGLDGKHEPLANQAIRNLRTALGNRLLLMPSKRQLIADLANSKVEIDSIPHLFVQYNVVGFEPGLRELRRQVSEYNAFVRKMLLPRARQSFALPRELYVEKLRSYGIDEAPEQLISKGRRAFASLRPQVQAMADRVALEHSFTPAPFQEVVADLRSNQIQDSGVLHFYRERAQRIDTILRRSEIVPMPPFPLTIRLATAAETATIPAPFFSVPPLLGNPTSFGEFVVPLLSQSGQKVTDFTYDGAAWMLCSHEGRPGHALQFWSMIHNGTSVARAVYAFNSANVEGWGVYGERLMQPFMPDDGKLVTLQFRLARIAYSFLDPELQTGRISPTQARSVLVNDIGISTAYADSLIRRFTYLIPGQGPSYFYGYSRMMELRAREKSRLGSRFSVRKFNDVVLREGLMPFDLLDKAVEQDLLQ
jgi:hypothetical protein